MMSVTSSAEQPAQIWLAGLLSAATASADDASAAIDVAVRFGRKLPAPGRGDTALRWSVLAAVAEQDLTVARVLEAHADALAILNEAGMATPAGSWGVFAAESPTARLDAVHDHDGWTLTGTKPWCSLGGALDHALVTAHTADGRGLFAVSLQDPDVRAEPAEAWVARGLRTVSTVPVHFDSVRATPIGDAGWYLTRSGFAWGGIGVAACWLGGAQALAATLRTALTSSGRCTAIGEMHVGAVDASLYAARTVLADAAARVDGDSDVLSKVEQGWDDALDPEFLALRVRTVIADAVELTLRHVTHALGPAPLGFDEAFARRVADLQLYVRQHHAEADLARLGARVLGRTGE